MTRLNISLLFVAVILALPGTAQDFDETMFLEGLAPCELPSVAEPPPDWRTLGTPHEDIQLIAPLGLQIDSDPGVLSWHGGAKWDSQSAQVVIRYGYWNQNSFADSGFTYLCRGNINGLAAMIMTATEPTGTTVGAWIITPGSGHEPVVEAKTEIPETAWQIILSIAALDQPD